MNDDIIDLNDLAPESVKVKYGELVIEIKPPKMSDLVRIANMAKRIQALTDDDAEIDADSLSLLEEELTNKLYELVPDLAGKSISMPQMTKLIQVLSSMAIPSDAKELDKRGITADDTKKDR